jgi:hypothetical protein
LLRSFRDGGPALDRPNHSPTQILRIRLRHSCWPPPSRKLESYSRRYGNPRVSLLGKRSSSGNTSPVMNGNSGGQPRGCLRRPGATIADPEMCRRIAHLRSV